MSTTTILYRDIAPGAIDGAQITATEATPFSDPSMLADDEHYVSQAATLERNVWTLDGTRRIYGGGTEPYWSSVLSGDDCTLDPAPVVTLTLDGTYTSPGITLVFDTSSSGGYCSDVLICWYRSGALLTEKAFSPDRSIYFCQTTVEQFDKVEITLRKTALPACYAKLSQVIIGVTRVFDMSQIRSARVVAQTDLLAQELPASVLEWVLDSSEDVEYIFQERQPFEVRCTGFGQQEESSSTVGVYYLSDSRRTAKRIYSLNCEDAIGVLERDSFSGGVYNGYSARQLISDIVDGQFEVVYDPSSGIGDESLTGILMPSTRREALQQVLFAFGVCAATDGGETIRIFLPGGTPESIGAGRTYTGASVDTSAVITAVRVTAHTYTKSSDGSIEIGGERYRDTETVYTVENPDVTSNTKTNVVEITGATLVSAANGQAVAQRVYNYYAKRDAARAKIVWRGEKLGDAVTLPNPWGGTNTGNIVRMDLTLSNTVAADPASKVRRSHRTQRRSTVRRRSSWPSRSSRYGSTRRWSMRASCTPESRSSAEAELPKFGQRPNLYVLCANVYTGVQLKPNYPSSAKGRTCAQKGES